MMQRILQLIENLYRAELTALRHAEDLAELIELVQAEEGGQVAHPGGNQTHDRGVSRAAKVLGFSRREVGRSLRIASITIEAKAKAIEVGFDKNQSVLLTIAEEEGVEAQLGKIDELTKATTSGSKASPSSKTKANKKASKEAAGLRTKTMAVRLLCQPERHRPLIPVISPIRNSKAPMIWPTWITAKKKSGCSPL